MALLPIPFAKWSTYAGHSGIDFQAPEGTPFLASGPGEVVRRGYSARAGYTIRVRYDNGALIAYCHMNSWAGCPKAGTRVAEGTPLGRVGKLGSRSTGPHLHAENVNEPTSVGFWKRFDKNRVVGAKPAGGGNATPGQPTPAPKEIRVKHYHTQDSTARSKGRTLKPGEHFYLNTTLNAPASKATNVTHLVGPYSITPHVYAQGKPGDVLTLTLLWQNTKAKPVANSEHYQERLVVDKDGQIQASREFKRAVAEGYAVYASLSASRTNAGAIRVTLFDADAYLFTVA